MTAVEISLPTARRFLLGRSGLWPGRRWQGLEGAAEAIHQIEALQLDPVVVVARSHEIALWSRVAGCQPGMLDELQHEQRRFFDYGTHLDVYPMAELRHWRLHMLRRAAEPQRMEFAGSHQPLLAAVRKLIAERGPSLNRDITGNAITRQYRGGKDTSLALYHLWLTGELMTAGRRRFERYYDLTNRVVPPEHDVQETPEIAEDFLARKTLRRLGLTTLTWWSGHTRYAFHRSFPPKEAAARMRQLVDEGAATGVKLEGRREPWFISTVDLPALETVADSRLPLDWMPLGATTDTEVTLLSPLDPVIHIRDRTEILWDFFYRWEIYVPDHKRQWGPYTLPILWRDTLAGRIDCRADRANRTLIANAIWFEAESLARDREFHTALAAGFANFAAFHGATAIDLTALDRPGFRRSFAAALRRQDRWRIIQ